MNNLEQQDHVPDFGASIWSNGVEVNVTGNTMWQALLALKEAATAKWGGKEK